MQHRLISKLYFLWSKVLHSIPILLHINISKRRIITLKNSKLKGSKQLIKYNKPLRYVSYSIPLMCSLALLLLISSLVIVKGGSNQVYAEEGISTYATTANPTATLTIENSHLDTIASPGTVNYVSSKVDVSASDITGYSLILSGPESLSGNTPITGAGGKNPNDMVNNSWGYAWTSEEANDTTTYNTLNPNGTSLKEIGTGANSDTKVTNFSVNFSRQLTFAAKFAEGAASGHYKANVTLSLAATPREVATGFNGIYDMQDMTGTICAEANTGDVGSLEDIRDGNVYSIVRLSDGNCWMASNLALTKEGMESYNGSATLTPADSDVAADFTVPASLHALSDGSFGAKVDLNTAQVYDGGYQHEQYKSSYGAYYNWNAATAGTGNSTVLGDDTNVRSSICPKGWTLPTSADYTKILNIAGITNTSEGSAILQAPPYNYATSGFLYNAKMSEIGTGGKVWSSTGSSSLAYFLSFGNSGVSVLRGQRQGGVSVRCIANNDRTIHDITTMQEMTAKVCANTPTGFSKTLSDSRDGNSYTVTKLEDDNCWMTQNLRLVGSRILTSSDSDLATNYTLPVSSNADWSEVATLERVYYPGDATNGAYYTWCVATANSCNDISSSVTVASSSICPKNWKIPSRQEYLDLLAQTGIANLDTASEKYQALLSSPYNFVAAGGLDSRTGSLSVGSTTGQYWSSTGYATSKAELLYVNSSSVMVGGYPYNSGLSVRCIAR